MTSSASPTLQAALQRWELDLEDAQIGQLEQYCRLLWEWNQRLNLTRHTDFDRFVQRDLVDCWQLAPLLGSEETVLDIGSGGGVPGLVLAILRPELQITVSESVGKKAQVLKSLVDELQLPVRVYAGRAEELLGEVPFSTLVARAVGPLWKMLKWLAPHWDQAGRLLAIKGPSWIQERGEARHRGYLSGLELRKLAQYPMPGTDGESVVLVVWPKRRCG